MLMFRQCIRATSWILTNLKANALFRLAGVVIFRVFCKREQRKMNLSVGQEGFEISCQILGTTHFAITKLSSEKLLINHIFAIAVNGILIIPTILLNATAIITILKSSQLNSKPCYFIILVQSVIDLAVGVLGIPIFIFFMASGIGGISTCLATTLALRSTILPVGASTNTLCAMTLERYIAILHPFAYSTQVTNKRLLIGVGCCTAVEWSVIILSFAIHWLFEIYAMVAQALSFFFIAFVYTRIYLVVRKLAQSRNKSHEGNLTSMKLFLREIKQAKSCFIVVICFCVLGFLPTTIAVPFFPSFDQFEELAIKIWIMTLGLCNSSFNSVIFFWTKRMLKKEAVKMLKNTMKLC
jgi:hypothetical protein